MAKRIQVGGRIESKEVGGIVTGAAEILDDEKGKKQSVINGETDDELLRLDQSKQDNLTFDNAPTEGSDNPVKSGGVYAADKALSDAIEAILLLIPSASSALNKLVDTAMMNSSISTATATFKGTYNVVTDLSLTVDATHEQIAAALGNVISTADNNDYAFVQVPVSAESMDIRRTERYKFNGTAWGYEYDLNTSGFTAAQWAAINSGITIALVGKLIGLPTSSELQALLGQKQNTLTFDNVPTAGSANPVKSGGVHTAINDEKMAREQLGQTVTGIDGRVGNVEEVIPTGAAANNKLVANNSMEAYVTSIIEAITASFTIATADGHINLTLTQTNGRVASLTLTSSDIASAQALTALTGRVSTAESNITSLGGRVSTNETDIANLQQLYNDLQQSKPEPVTALPETGQQQGVIYRLAGTTSYSDYMWNGSTWVLMATYNNAIDPRPKKASQNLVTSGGVFDNMGALDVSELNATENPHILAQYVDLSAALVAIPTDYQKGGMSIKFVQSSDNKYVQYFLTKDEWSTSDADWEKMNLEEEVSQLNQEVNGTVVSSLDVEAGKIFTSSGYVSSSKYAASVILPAGKFTLSANANQNTYTAIIVEYISDTEGIQITPSWLYYSTPVTFESERSVIVNFRKNSGADDITASDITAINSLFSVEYDNSASLVSRIEALESAGYTFKDVATPTTNPGTPTNKVFYLATEVGTYANFGDLSVALNDGAVALCFDGPNWVKVILDIAPNNILMPVEVEIAGETADTYIKSNGDIGTLTGVKTDYTVVNAGDIFQMKISGAVGSSNYAWAFYSATPFSSATLVSRGPASASANGTHLVIAPQNGYLVRTLVYNATYEIKQYKADKIGNILNELSELSESHPALRYSLAEGVLKVAFGYGDKDFVVEMQRTGGNNIFDFKKFSTIVKGGKLGVDTETTVMSISTDWHSPFLVAAVNNADGDDITSHYFTGGNHQYNNTGSGSTATGRTTLLNFFVDGNAITAGSGFANMVEVRWTNCVQGYNTRRADGTGREILQENHRLIITAGKFSESVEVIPLEDVSFEKWYGFQFSGRATIYPNVLFVGATNKGVITSADGSGTKLSNRVIGFGNNHRVKMFVDNSVDLGQRYALSAVSGAITAGDNKGYFQIIDNLSVGSGEHYYLEGGWEFMPV